jgi:hypothetical protein
MRFLTSCFFSRIIFPQAPEYIKGSILNFLKILGDILNKG